MNRAQADQLAGEQLDLARAQRGQQRRPAVYDLVYDPDGRPWRMRARREF